MEKTTKRGAKKLLMSVMVMVVALVAAATSTFAWFTINATPSVGEFEVKVTSVDGLFIALDTTAGGIGANYDSLNYRANVTGTEISTYLGTLDATNPNVLVPQTTTDGVNFKDLLNRPAQPDGKPFGAGVTAAERAYFSFTLYFRSSTEDTQLSLDFHNYSVNGTDASGMRTYVRKGNAGDNRTTVPLKWLNEQSKRPTAWLFQDNDTDWQTANPGVDPSDYDNTAVTRINLNAYTGLPGDNWIDAGQPIDADAMNAMRYSFTGKSDLAGSVFEDTAVWNPKSLNGYHTGNLALDLYNADIDTGVIEVPAGGAYDPANVFDGETEASDLASEVLVKTSTLKDGLYYGSITINLWLEGFDGDCLNGSMDDGVLSAFQFRIVPVTTP